MYDLPRILDMSVTDQLERVGAEMAVAGLDVCHVEHVQRVGADARQCHAAVVANGQFTTLLAMRRAGCWCSLVR